MTTAHNAAAYWGSAQNRGYSDEARLNFAMMALDFFGGFYEKIEESAENGVMMVFELNDDGSVEPYYAGGSWDRIPPAELVSNNPNLNYHLFYARVHLLPLGS